MTTQYNSTPFLTHQQKEDHGRTGLILLAGGGGGGGILPKFIGDGGGGRENFFPDTPKKNFPDIPKTFPQTYENFHIKKFSLASRNFRKDTKFFHDISKFCRNFYVLPECRIDFWPTGKIGGGGGRAHTPMKKTSVMVFTTNV